MRPLMLAAALALSLLTAPTAFAAEDPCATAGACRAVGTISLPDGKGGMRPFKVDKTLPWLVQNNLMLFAGDTVVISLPEDRDDILPTTLVATGPAAASHKLEPGQLRLAFTASKDGMMLNVTSGHRRWLHYVALMVTPDMKPHKTSVCPVMAGKLAFETWPHPIIYLNVAHFKAVKDGEMACR